MLNDELPKSNELFYNYKILNSLQTNQQNIIELIMNNNNFEVNLCFYSINTSGCKPFIQFYFIREINYNSGVKYLLTLPCFDYKNLRSINNTNYMMDYIMTYVYSIFPEISENNNCEYKGYYAVEDRAFMFINLTPCKLIIDDIRKNSKISIVLEKEIYCGKIFDNYIDFKIRNFFLSNNEIFNLYDEKNNIYEKPDIWFVGKENHQLQFTYTFGVSKDINGIFGPYYYFTTYKNILRQNSQSQNSKNNIINFRNNKENKINGGIIRFAIFTGNILVKFNLENDKIDESIIKKQKIEYEIENSNDRIEALTLKITDYDGLWSNNYDSVYVGNINLDNGFEMKNTPILAIKDYSQQIPLSYHFISELLENDYVNNISSHKHEML